MTSQQHDNNTPLSQAASLEPISQPPPTPPTPLSPTVSASKSCSSHNSTSALSHPSTQSTLNTTTPSHTVKTENPVTWQKKRWKTIDDTMFQSMLAKSAEKGIQESLGDGKGPQPSSLIHLPVAFPPRTLTERSKSSRHLTRAGRGCPLKHNRRGNWAYAFERCLNTQKKADSKTARLQLEGEEGKWGGEENVPCIFASAKIDVNDPEVFVPYNNAIADYLREVAAAMTAKIAVLEVTDRMKKGARAINKQLKQEVMCQKFRAEAYGRLATVVESFPVAITPDVLVNNSVKKDDSSISSSSVTIKDTGRNSGSGSGRKKTRKKLLLKCPGSSLGIVVAAINRFTPQFFKTKRICVPGQGQNYLQNPEMDKAMALINDPQVKAVNSLKDIWGVGMSTAAKMYNWGVTSPAMLWSDKEVIGCLNAAQLIGLKHVEDFKKKIPRAELELILERVKETVDYLGGGKLTCQACGSYRRGKGSSGDIDVLITPKDGFESFQPSRCFIQIIEHLTQRRVLTDHLAFDTKPSIKPKRSYMGVCNVAGIFRRIDIKCYPKHSEAFALLYFTGSGHFNRSMRKFCKTAKLKLTDEGLWYRKGKSNDSGVSVLCKEEEDIFNAIGLDYIRPEFRSVGIEGLLAGGQDERTGAGVFGGGGDVDSQETEEDEMWDIEEMLAEEEIEEGGGDGEDDDDDVTV
ncbi:hypothetical protein TL16_g01275 [Triparma laevis f. inornata]|uniref:DNA-directed DNA polymerase X domain-containing protein n=1 Tax=Triparma laevis f. inornata TaxID=1714386 RepID=A0A9W6ZHD0_9STRA|nr:hypothetical protein TL16_g01275 [Triparma laevis f. inornata]